MKIVPHFKINGYEFIREIGRGQFSTVWESVHLSTTKTVAIKCISNEDDDSKTEITILKEIYFNQSIFHPFICQYFDFFEANSTFFLVFENCVENLVTFSNKRGFLDEKTAHKIFCELLYAVESLHNDYHIIHRDLKVENILIDSNKNVRLSDFGLSVSNKPLYSHSPRRNNSNSKAILNQQVGSIYYMSPEMVKKEEYDKSIDIWSLGIILYAITNGRLPFDGNSYDSVQQKILFTQPQFQPHFNSFSQNLKTLIIRMLDKNRKSRITIDEIKKNPWFAERKYKKIEELQKNSFNLALQIDHQIIEKFWTENQRNSVINSVKNNFQQKNDLSLDQLDLYFISKEASKKMNENNKSNQNQAVINNDENSIPKVENKSNAINITKTNDIDNSNENQNINSNENQNITSNENQNINSNENQNINSNENQNITSNENQNITSNENQNINSNENQNITSNENQNITSNENQNITSNENQNINSNENQNINSNENQNITSNENQNIKSNENQNISSTENTNLATNSKEIEYDKIGIKIRSNEFVTYLIWLREKIKEQIKIEESDIIVNKPAIITSARAGKRRISQPSKPTTPFSQTMRPNVKKPIVPTKKPGSLSKTKKQPLSLTMNASEFKKKKS